MLLQTPVTMADSLFHNSLGPAQRTRRAQYTWRFEAYSISFFSFSYYTPYAHNHSWNAAFIKHNQKMAPVQRRESKMNNPTCSMKGHWPTSANSVLSTSRRHSVPLPWQQSAYCLEAEYLGHAWSLLTSLPGVSHYVADWTCMRAWSEGWVERIWFHVTRDGEMRGQGKGSVEGSCLKVGKSWESIACRLCLISTWHEAIRLPMASVSFLIKDE